MNNYIITFFCLKIRLMLNFNLPLVNNIAHYSFSLKFLKENVCYTIAKYRGTVA
jgi:hypothetical protein